MVLKALCGAYFSLVRATDAAQNTEKDPAGNFYSQETRRK